MDNEKIVNSIKSLCKEKSITVGQLEKTVGLSQGLVSKWKDKTPSLDKIIDIADFFHVSIDEVVGRNQLVSDEFISKLIQMTENNELRWNSYKPKSHNPKRYFGVPMDTSEFLCDSDYSAYKKTHKETSYYAIFNNGYISIYAAHINLKITEPYEIKIFIQPDNTSELILQEYTIEELLPLWIKVLNSLSYNIPDEIKAADIKNQILKNGNPNNKASNKSINHEFSSYNEFKEVFSDEIQKTIDIMNSDSFKTMQKILENKDFMEAIENAQTVREFLMTDSNKKKK